MAAGAGGVQGQLQINTSQAAGAQMGNQPQAMVPNTQPFTSAPQPGLPQQQVNCSASRIIFQINLKSKSNKGMSKHVLEGEVDKLHGRRL